MDEEELLVDLLAYANKFINSQYDCNIAIGDASYKNIDLLTVYKIDQLYKSNKISEDERNHLLDLHYKKLVLEQQMDATIIEEERDSIDNKLFEVYKELAQYGLGEDLSIEYLIDSTFENKKDESEPINADFLIATIRIGDILRNDYELSIDETAECLDLNKDILIYNTSNKEYFEFFQHMGYRFWARILYGDFIETKGAQKKLVPDEKK